MNIMAACIAEADAPSIMVDDQMRWRDHLLKAARLDPKTVRDVYIAPSAQQSAGARAKAG
ncbi:hypothetical protein ACFOYU_10615 [Microvirga sp. GCM10011540]|uniref:hypothetical protein n=1 Tax=Microvirga sp. GCM10011540 TaxID=3317338 RepID=UPI00360B5CC5